MSAAARCGLQGRDLDCGLLAPLVPSTGDAAAGNAAASDAAALGARLAADDDLYLPGLLPPAAVAGSARRPWPMA